MMNMVTEIYNIPQNSGNKLENKEFLHNISMRSTVFQPPPRENMYHNSSETKVNNSFNGNYIFPNNLKNMNSNPSTNNQEDIMLNEFPFTNEATKNSERDTVADCGINNMNSELFIMADAKYACDNESKESSNAKCFFGSKVLCGGIDTVDKCTRIVSPTFGCTSDVNEVIACVPSPKIIQNYQTTVNQQENTPINTNNSLQSEHRPTVFSNENLQNCIGGRKTCYQIQRGMQNLVPNVDMLASPNCFISTDVPGQESFKQFYMLNTTFSYMSGNEEEKLLIHNSSETRKLERVQTMFPPLGNSIVAHEIVPTLINVPDETSNISDCYKVSMLNYNAQEFPDDMEKLIYEINVKMRTIPSSSTLNGISHICCTARYYCEKYNQMSRTSESSFNNLMSIFLLVAYSWVSCQKIEDTNFFHHNLKDHMITWKQSSETLLNMLISTINNWHHFMDYQSKSAEVSNCNHNNIFDQNTVHCVNAGTYLFPVPAENNETSLLSQNPSLYMGDDLHTPRTKEETCSEKCHGVQLNVCNYKSEIREDNYVGSPEASKNVHNITNSTENLCHLHKNIDKSVNTSLKNKVHCNKSRDKSQCFEKRTISESKCFDKQIEAGRLQKNCVAKDLVPSYYQIKKHNDSNESKKYAICSKFQGDSESKRRCMRKDDTEASLHHNQQKYASENMTFDECKPNKKQPRNCTVSDLPKVNNFSRFRNNIEHTDNGHSRYASPNQNIKSQQFFLHSDRAKNYPNRQRNNPFWKFQTKRTNYFKTDYFGDSGTIESFEYIRPGSYKIPLKSSISLNSKNFASQPIEQTHPRTSVEIANDSMTSSKSETKSVKTNTVHKVVQSSNDSDYYGCSEMQLAHQRNISTNNVWKDSQDATRSSFYRNNKESTFQNYLKHNATKHITNFPQRKTELRECETNGSDVQENLEKNIEDMLPDINSNQFISQMKKCKTENVTFSDTSHKCVRQVTHSAGR